MAGNRKLQAEIDRTLKKVQEGVEVFESIWEKVNTSQNAHQKAKHDADLKKEIKKLQRYRDQIKTWASSSDVKDKKPLIEARKQIETEMERFKICEKQTKTKAYSKEGLGQSKLDPQTKARQACQEWVNKCIDELSTQTDMLDAELETLQVGKKQKKNESKITTLDESIERNKWHVDKLEKLLRLVDNETVTPQELDDIKESIEYYVESNQDPDFVDDEYVYDQFNLDDEDQEDGDEDQDDDELEAKEEPNTTETPKSSAKTPVKSTPQNQPQSTPQQPTPQSPPLQSQTAPRHQQTTPSTVGHQRKQPAVIGPSSEDSEGKERKTIWNGGDDGKEIKRPSKPDGEKGGSRDSTLLNILQQSSQKVPDTIPVESDRPKQYVPRNPFPPIPGYPQMPPSIFDTSSIFEKFDTDTLFFIFYYQQGTYQQYLAARELKKQSWRYHKKYLTWFQRHEEPKVTTDEYEQGTYVYFDYETGWCQRIKTEFTFEYQFLEDELNA